MIPKPKLFLGLLLSRDIVRHLEALPNEIYCTYCDSDSSLLRRKEIEGKTYLGREASKPITIEQVTLLELNLLSILKKILPDYKPPRGGFQLIGYFDP